MQKILEQPLGEINFKVLDIHDQVLLVTGRSSYTGCGAAPLLEVQLAGKHVVRFSDFQVNPLLDDVKKGLALIREDRPCTVIAVGGGSPMDMGKLIKALAGQSLDHGACVRGEGELKSNPHINLIAIPTTSGSGSESTHFAVVYMGKTKYSLARQDLLPGTVILDPALTDSMSPYQTACTGLDALSQGVESYWSVNADDTSREFSRRAITLVRDNLVRAVNNPDRESRRAMLKAANLAGQAINLTKTTAAHAFCYYLTSHYGVPHGHAAALLLGKFFLFNRRVADQDLSDSSSSPGEVRQTLQEICALLGQDTPVEADRYITDIMKQCGLETDLKTILDFDKSFDDFFSSVNLQRLKNNPRLVTDPLELKELLQG